MEKYFKYKYFLSSVFQIQIPIPKKYFKYVFETLVFQIPPKKILFCKFKICNFANFSDLICCEVRFIDFIFTKILSGIQITFY